MKKIAWVFLMALLLLMLGILAARAGWFDKDSFARNCPNNLIRNGNFEQGETSWESLPDSRYPYALIVKFDDAHDGQYSAMLGGDEGTWDRVRQKVTIPSNGYLTFWWRMNTYESEIFRDTFSVNLRNDQEEEIANLTWHGITGVEDTWTQDSIDLRSYAGMKVWLEFNASNDHYFFSTFYVDSVCLRKGNKP